VTGRSTGSAVTHPVVGGTVEQTAAEVDAAGGSGVPVVCDHTEDGQVRALFDRVARQSHGLDLLVNNVWAAVTPACRRPQLRTDGRCGGRTP
jgi:NAD(P)-dependent dehydrogenase (short-subunit alcohol dehydrogenase family)